MTPEEVVPVLQRAKVEHVLVGLYGIVGWLKEERATQDVDLLISKRHHKRAFQVLTAALPDLTARDTPVVTRLFREGKPVVDLMKPHHPLLAAAFKYSKERQIDRIKARVPTLEMALALKFFAMTSPGREPSDKHQDAHDFILLVTSNNRLDEALVRELCNLAFDGGGREALDHVANARAKRMLEI